MTGDGVGLDILKMLPPESQELLQPLLADLVALNPLAQPVLAAEMVAGVHEETLSRKSGVIDLGLVFTEVSDGGEPIVRVNGFPLARSIEDGGLLGCADWFSTNPRFEPVFSNDFAYRRYGIDLIAKDRETGQWVFVESKGTTRRIRRPLDYLAKTKHKGRQLSWEWCWVSLQEFANEGPSAKAFLSTFEDLLNFKVSRLLLVNRLEPTESRYLVVETRVFNVDDLGARPDWSHLDAWLKEMVSADYDNPLQSGRALLALVGQAFTNGILNSD